jgi:hypothetical protein
MRSDVEDGSDFADALAQHGRHPSAFANWGARARVRPKRERLFARTSKAKHERDAARQPAPPPYTQGMWRRTKRTIQHPHTYIEKVCLWVAKELHSGLSH